MIKSSIERVARTRYVMPVVVALAVATVVVNEVTYRHSRDTLTNGIALTDARLKAGEVLQRLTDAETAARAYLINGAEVDLVTYRQTVDELQRLEQDAFQLIADVDPLRIVSVDEVRTRIRDQLDAMNEWVGAVDQGQRSRAYVMASSDRNRERNSDLRRELDLVLARAASIQSVARVSLYDAILLNRVALHLAVLVSLIALVLFMRQLRESDARKAGEHQRLSIQVARRTAELRELAGHLVHTREDERARLARELHDEMGGLLTAMKLEIARLRRVPDVPATALERIAGVEQRLNEGIAVKRRIIENLRPSVLDQLGLVAALELLCEQTATSLGIPVQADLQPVALGKDSELTAYRLVQESLTNASKHAKARAVKVTLSQQGEQVRVAVSDDGQGFDESQVPPGHHGLLGMRVRVESHAGRLSIQSAPGRGTDVVAFLPASLAA